MNSENTERTGPADGFRFFLKWFLVGALVAALTYVVLAIAAIGGVSTPPDIWVLCISLGMVVLPFLLMLGGVPAAIQIARGREWKRAAKIAFVMCAASWLVIVGVVFLGPFIFGWKW